MFQAKTFSWFDHCDCSYNVADCELTDGDGTQTFQVFVNHLSVDSHLPIWQTAGFRGPSSTMPEKGGAVRAISFKIRKKMPQKKLFVR